MKDTVDITLPEQHCEGTRPRLQQWLVAVGDTVKVDDPVAELETDKVTVELCAPASGIIKELLFESGTELTPAVVLGRIETTAASKTSESARHLLGPAVKRLLREHNLDIESIAGSGRGGRITRDDVLMYLRNPASRRRAQDPISPAAPAGRLVGHTPMRKALARHMVESLLHTSPHVTSVFEMDMAKVMEHRHCHKKEFTLKGVNLTFSAYFLAAAAAAIAAVPRINARFHDDALEIFDDVNIGVATALGDEGLVVPVVAQVQNKNLFQLAAALQAQTEKARAGKLSEADMKNGTFTLSNHGVSGSLLATPIVINQPQVAILGVGKLEKRAVVIEEDGGDRDGSDRIAIRPRCYVTLTIDHRALDAYQANHFLSAFVKAIECWGE